MDMQLACTAPLTHESESFAGSLLEGLRKNPKEIACKFFYDTEGSQIFDAIC